MNTQLPRTNLQAKGSPGNVRQHIVLRQPVMTVIQVQKDRLPKSRLAHDNRRRQLAGISN